MHARDAILASVFALCAIALVTLAIVTAPSPPPRSPSTPEEIARALDEKERSRERADLMRRLDVAAALAGVGLGTSGVALAVSVVGRPHPQLRMLGLGAVVGVAGPLLAWTGHWLVAARDPFSETRGWLMFAGLILAALGFVVVGAGLRPSGSVRRGAALGGAVYSCAGLLWLFGYQALLGGNATGVTRALADPVAVYVLVLWWPVQVATHFGLFGLTFGS